MGLSAATIFTLVLSSERHAIAEPKHGLCSDYGSRADYTGRPYCVSDDHLHIHGFFPSALVLALGAWAGRLEPGKAFAVEAPDPHSADERWPAPVVLAEDEWSESPRHTGGFLSTGDYGIDLKVDYEDSTGRKGTVRSFHRLTILTDGFEIRSDGQSTKFPFNGRTTKRFDHYRRTVTMDCFTMSTSSQIALQCTTASKDEKCVGDFVWKFVVGFDSAGDCTKVTTDQQGSHDCEGKKDQAAFHSTAFACSRLPIK